MTSVSRTEILPEQKKPLDDLRTSIEKDTDTSVQAEAATLQSAIDKNNRTDVMTALRTLEARLESLAAMDRHREKLQKAKYAVGYAMDSVDTAVSSGVDAVKAVTVDPVMSAIKANVPGAADAMDAMKPTVDAGKEMYAKLPTALRLPVLGAILAGSSWVASFPVKWFGKLVGMVSDKGEKAVEELAKKMRSAGKIAFIGGLGLGAASFLGGKYRDGTFDPAIEAIKGKPGAKPAGPDKDPAAPKYSNEELRAGVDIDGKSVKIVDGNTIEVAGQQWTFGNSVTSLQTANVGDGGVLTVNVTAMMIPISDTFTWKTVKAMVQKLATASADTVEMIGNDGNPYKTSLGTVVKLTKKPATAPAPKPKTV